MTRSYKTIIILIFSVLMNFASHAGNTQVDQSSEEDAEQSTNPDCTPIIQKIIETNNLKDIETIINIFYDETTYLQVRKFIQKAIDGQNIETIELVIKKFADKINTCDIYDVLGYTLEKSLKLPEETSSNPIKAFTSFVNLSVKSEDHKKIIVSVCKNLQELTKDNLLDLLLPSDGSYLNRLPFFNNNITQVISESIKNHEKTTQFTQLFEAINEICSNNKVRLLLNVVFYREMLLDILDKNNTKKGIVKAINNALDAIPFQLLSIALESQDPDLILYAIKRFNNKVTLDNAHQLAEIVKNVKKQPDTFSFNSCSYLPQAVAKKANSSLRELFIPVLIADLAKNFGSYLPTEDTYKYHWDDDDTPDVYYNGKNYNLSYKSHFFIDMITSGDSTDLSRLATEFNKQIDNSLSKDKEKKVKDIEIKIEILFDKIADATLSSNNATFIKTLDQKALNFFDKIKLLEKALKTLKPQHIATVLRLFHKAVSHTTYKKIIDTFSEKDVPFKDIYEVLMHIVQLDDEKVSLFFISIADYNLEELFLNIISCKIDTKKKESLIDRLLTLKKAERDLTCHPNNVFYNREYAYEHYYQLLRASIKSNNYDFITYSVDTCKKNNIRISDHSHYSQADLITDAFDSDHTDSILKEFPYYSSYKMNERSLSKILTAIVTKKKYGYLKLFKTIDCDVLYNSDELDDFLENTALLIPSMNIKLFNELFNALLTNTSLKNYRKTIVLHMIKSAIKAFDLESISNLMNKYKSYWSTDLDAHKTFIIAALERNDEKIMAFILQNCSCTLEKDMVKSVLSQKTKIFKKIITHEKINCDQEVKLAIIKEAVRLKNKKFVTFMLNNQKKQNNNNDSYKKQLFTIVSQFPNEELFNIIGSQKDPWDLCDDMQKGNISYECFEYLIPKTLEEYSRNETKKVEKNILELVYKNSKGNRPKIISFILSNATSFKDFLLIMQKVLEYKNITLAEVLVLSYFQKTHLNYLKQALEKNTLVTYLFLPNKVSNNEQLQRLIQDIKSHGSLTSVQEACELLMKYCIDTKNRELMIFLLSKITKQPQKLISPEILSSIVDCLSTMQITENMQKLSL